MSYSVVVTEPKGLEDVAEELENTTSGIQDIAGALKSTATQGAPSESVADILAGIRDAMDTASAVTRVSVVGRTTFTTTGRENNYIAASVDPYNKRIIEITPGDLPNVNLADGTYRFYLFPYIYSGWERVCGFLDSLWSGVLTIEGGYVQNTGSAFNLRVAIRDDDAGGNFEIALNGFVTKV